MNCDMLAPAVDTHTETANGWLDDFNHGTLMGELPDAYVSGCVNGDDPEDGEATSAPQCRWFIHNNHWMDDIRSDSGQYTTKMSHWMRPNRTFTPKPDGSVVIEFEVATPIAGTRDGPVGDSWPEFAITTADRPTGFAGPGNPNLPDPNDPWYSEYTRDGIYFYDTTWANDTMGCRMQQDRRSICAFKKAGSSGAGSPDRLWEANQNGLDVVPGSEFGGDPTIGDLGSAWAVCAAGTDPDTVCRNVFRWTLTATTLKMEVKKPGGTFVEYYHSTPCNDREGCTTGQMGRILNNPGGFRVFFSQNVTGIENDAVIRSHWDHLAVNP